MTVREGAVLSAYTGILICEYSAFHEYIEHILDRKVYTHEIPSLLDEIKEKATDEARKIIEQQC